MILVYVLCSFSLNIDCILALRGCSLSFFFFFSSRRRHTRFDCDWSSDVCSSDLQTLMSEYVRTGSEPAFRELVARYLDLVYSSALRLVGGDAQFAEDVSQTEIGRASCRERV